MTHGCISGPGHGPRWESKCGAGLRIQHALAELVGSVYGRVVAFYRPAGGKHAARARPGSKARAMRFRLTSEQRRRLDEQRRAVPAELREAFATAFRAWKESWQRGSLVINSDPRSRAAGPEFDGLVALGPRILPLVVEGLTDPDNFFALQLYDAIQPNGQLVVQYGPDDERILEGEQGRAWRTVQAWFANQ
jgi:hypothetical protein